MSVGIRITHAEKAYGDNTVIPDLTLNIEDGEFFTLLGPSGCGKTTLLRMIAGFNTIEGGQFYFNDKLINDLDPSKRNIGMVFQNYAIFPHLTVKKNVEFGLTNRKYSKDEISTEAEKFLELMQIENFKDRLPEKLSGGQQQRVALARALVVKPDVLLMDEPLSNLDAKLRVEMRTVIKNLQRDVGITTVYVTHDQEEAMAVSDRIAVMKLGIIQQIGSPEKLYQRPENLFVATFIGKSNILDAHLQSGDNGYEILLKNGDVIAIDSIHSDHKHDQEVRVSIRPEEFYIDEQCESGIRSTIADTTFLGLNTHYNVQIENGEYVEVIQESSIGRIIPKGAKVTLRVKTEKINLFDGSGEQNLLLATKKLGQ